MIHWEAGGASLYTLTFAFEFLYGVSKALGSGQQVMLHYGVALLFGNNVTVLQFLLR